MYVVLQTIIFLCNITAPAFIIIYMPSALTFNGLSWQAAYVVVLLPIILHLVVCMTCTKNAQVTVTSILSLFMSFFFTMALVTSIFAVIYQYNNLAHYFIIALAAIDIFAGILHPFEAFNLIYLPLYIVGTIVMFLLFFNFALCNINDMGWGTREAVVAQQRLLQNNIFTRLKNALLKRIEAFITPPAPMKDNESVKPCELKQDDLFDHHFLHEL